MRLSFVGCLLLLGPIGCSSSPSPEVPGEAVSASAELTVIVYAEHLQQAVPAVGTVTSLGDKTVVVVDTRAAPERGHVLTGLSPGQYKIEIKQRYLVDETVQPVDGEEVFYLEPGATRSADVVVTDSDDDKLGCLSFPAGYRKKAASAPHLPLELTHRS